MFKEEALKKSYKNVELIRCVSANVINKANFEEEKIEDDLISFNNYSNNINYQETTNNSFLFLYSDIGGKDESIFGFDFLH